MSRVKNRRAHIPLKSNFFANLRTHFSEINIPFDANTTRTARRKVFPAVLNSLRKQDNRAPVGVCQGDLDNPPAREGKVCIYPAGFADAAGLRALATPGDPSRNGFELRVIAAGSGDLFFRSVWAYQAP